MALEDGTLCAITALLTEYDSVISIGVRVCVWDARVLLEDASLSSNQDKKNRREGDRARGVFVVDRSIDRAVVTSGVSVGSQINRSIERDPQRWKRVVARC
jgi:hypothetical protein